MKSDGFWCSGAFDVRLTYTMYDIRQGTQKGALARQTPPPNPKPFGGAAPEPRNCKDNPFRTQAFSKDCRLRGLKRKKKERKIMKSDGFWCSGAFGWLRGLRKIEKRKKTNEI